MARDNYLLEELDDASVEYLRAAKRAAGAGLPGIYVPAYSFSPIWPILAGIGILIGVYFCVAPPLHDPTNITMLLTAGILLGGWLIFAGIRIGVAKARGNNLGAFSYADPWQLWKVEGAKVEHISADGIRSIHVFENRDNEGNYKNSMLTLDTVDGVFNTTIAAQVGAKEIEAYYKYWTETLAGTRLSRNLAEEHAARAKAYAYDQQVRGDEQFRCEVPIPSRVRQTAFGWLNLGLIVAAGAALYFLLHPLVVVWRDDELFDLLRTKQPNILRTYLLDPRNTRHRERVTEMLKDDYEPVIVAFQEQIGKTADPKVADLAEPLGEMLRALAVAKQPILTIRIREKIPPEIANLPLFDEAASRERIVLLKTELTDLLIAALGPQRLAVAEAPEGALAMLDLAYEFIPDKAGDCRIASTLTLRQTAADEAPSTEKKLLGPSFVVAKLPRPAQEMFAAYFGKEAAPVPP